LLSVNVDHVASLRQARRDSLPDPVTAAALVEMGGADGVTVHLRKDRRHVTERDVEILRQTVQTELTLEMAASEDLLRFAVRTKPDQVTLVPELVTEVTTTRGLDLLGRDGGLKSAVGRLRRGGIRVSLFVESDPRQVEAAAGLGADVVELNTDRYSRTCSSRRLRVADRSRKAKSRARQAGREAVPLLDELAEAGRVARANGLVVHVGHGLDYRSVVPILEMGIAEGFSIGFAVIARAVMVGLRDAVAEMKRILEVYP